MRYERRVKSVHPQTVDYGEWSNWEEVTKQDAIFIKSLIDRGYVHYELRALVTRDLTEEELAEITLKV